MNAAKLGQHVVHVVPRLARGVEHAVDFAALQDERQFLIATMAFPLDDGDWPSSRELQTDVADEREARRHLGSTPTLLRERLRTQEGDVIAQRRELGASPVPRSQAGEVSLWAAGPIRDPRVGREQQRSLAPAFAEVDLPAGPSWQYDARQDAANQRL